MLRLLLVLGLAALSQAAGTKRPNFIFIFADDLGYRDIGFRNSLVHTPVMDKLAEEGVIYTKSYVQAQCTPSRHSLMTGRYPHSSGMNHGVITDVFPWCTGLEYKFMPTYLKDLGYNTHMLGKWHLGACRKECTPAYRGFDTFEGAFAGMGHYFNHTTEEGAFDWFKQEKVDRSATGTHSQDIIQNEALKLIRKNGGETPFFMYLAFHNTHSPMEPKEEFLELYKDVEGITETRRGYLGLLSGLDYAIGEIVDGLKKEGLYDDTIIVFSSDNGGDVGEGDNSPLRGAKGSLFEGGVRANMFVHSPLLEKTGYINDELIHVSDWLPTFVSMAGGKVPEGDGIDGVDQSDLVLRGGPSARDSMVYFIDREAKIGPPEFGEMAIRNDRYKLIWGMPGYSDGYGMEALRVYDHPDYIEAASEYSDEDEGSRSKRGGRPILNDFQQLVLDVYANTTRVTPEQFEAGTGAKQLYDLEDDPYEENDLSGSASHQGIIDELTQGLKDAIAKRYEGPTMQSQIPDLSSLPHNFGGALGVGWCENTLPLPSELTDKCKTPKKNKKDCAVKTRRYFYNKKQKKCRSFVGCPAEGNNFSHKRMCKAVCDN